jgi:hypothetical protein
MSTPNTPAKPVPLAPPVSDDDIAAADSLWGML